MKIKDLPKEDRPREKALSKGIDALTDAELLALIIGSGRAGESALDLSYRLLNEYGGVSALAKASFASLLRFLGIGTAKTLSLCASFELRKRINGDLDSQEAAMDAEAIYERYRLRFENETQESLYLIYLSKKRRFLKEKLLYKGTAEKMVIRQSEIAKELLLSSCERFILLHNHPSGCPLPSPQDIEGTLTLEKAMKEVGVRLLDHIIIGQEGYYSFKDNGIL